MFMTVLHESKIFLSLYFGRINLNFFYEESEALNFTPSYSQVFLGHLHFLATANDLFPMKIFEQVSFLCLAL